MTKFKKYLLGLVMCLCMCLSSCMTYGQSTSYTKVYYDYVITGIVNEPGFVNDGYYSYHIVGSIPPNVYWELWPCGHVPLYNRSLVFQRWYYPDKWWVFYNGHRHHTYTPKKLPPRPNRNMRPPQRPPQRPSGQYRSNPNVRPNHGHRGKTNHTHTPQYRNNGRGRR